MNSGVRVATPRFWLAAFVIALAMLVLVPAAQAAEHKLIAFDAFNNDQFGTAVAIDGDVAVVGAPLNHPTDDRGAAYVFTRTASVWTLAAKLTASDQSGFEHFGQSVGISGDTIVIGAPADIVGVNFSQGSAYVFVKPLGGWATTSAFTAKLTASDGTSGDSFGQSVAISGDTVVAGAFGDDGAEGAAYVFVKPGGGWGTTSIFDAKLTTGDGAVNDQLGYAVSISGDTVVAGARGDDMVRGSAYVFVKPGGGWADTSTPDAKLTTITGALGDQFGHSVAIEGDTVVAGAPYDDSVRGSAYVFVKPGSGWTTTFTPNAKLLATLSTASDLTGWSVDLTGTRAVVGSPGDDLGGDSVYVFVKPPSGWSGELDATQKLVATTGVPGPQKGDQMGFAVGISGDTVIGGAPFHDDARGAAYVFDLAPTAVEFGSLTATTTRRGVLVRWRTANEHHTLGFNIYRERASGRLARINRALVRASGGGLGRTYAYLDRRPPRSLSSRYWIEAVNLDGTRTRYGPARASL